MTTIYDEVLYPTAVFAQTHPERLAICARLAGLDPVEPKRARILEVGGGNCMNLIGLATVWPECEAHGFDLAEVAIAKGQAFVDAAGLKNVHLAVEDILTAHQRYNAKSFDYVIVHGVYAWVPPHVREACMALVAHVLSDRGIGFVSYNCMPGGHIRQIMREMLLAEMGHITDPDLRLDAARSFLEEYGRDRPDDEALQTCLREHARSMLERPDAVLFHDELGDCYYPQALADVVAEGRRHGLRYLTDAGRNLHLNGFVPDDIEPWADTDAQVLNLSVRSDYRNLRFFRQTLFVRENLPIERRIDASRIAGLYLTTRLKRREDGSFGHGEDSLELHDSGMADALERAAARSPQRTPVGEIATTPDQLRVLLQLWAEWYVTLHLDPAPFVEEPGERPETIPLVRGMMRLGEQAICTLNHNLLKIDQAELRALLLAADGTRTVAQLAAMDHGIPGDQVAAALKASAQRALMWR